MKRRRIFIVTGVVGVVIILLTLSLWPRKNLTPIHDQACQANLKAIVLALHKYYREYHSLPSAYVLDSEGNRAHSWRVLILPHLNEQDLFDAYRFDEPWNGPNNAKLADRMPAVYRCPADRKGPSTTTNYLAVVGSLAAWPEHHARTFSDFQDGLSNTILLVESRDSGIHWMEPRDLKFGDAAESVNPDTSPSFSSFHGAHANCAMADSSVRSVSDDVDEDIWFEVLTASGGEPFSDLPVPTEFLEPKIGEFLPIVNAEELAGTDVQPVLSEPLRKGRNYVYCATFQLAWDTAKQALGGKVELEGAPRFAEQLNQSSFPRSDLAEDSFAAIAEITKNGRYDELTRKLKQRFPHVEPPEFNNIEDSLIFYAYLEKTLPFAAKFRSRKEPLQFRAGGKLIGVENFGFEELHEPNQSTHQVLIHDYRNRNDFVIRLRTRSDLIVLAKVQPSTTLASTLQSVRDRIRLTKGYARPSVEAKDTLIIPKINFSLDRTYSEFTSRRIAGGPLVITDAKQLVRFLLNEAGARLVSRAHIAVALNGHEEEKEDPNAPRDMRLDKPFLLFIQESAKSEPYLVVWIGNDELLVKQK